MRLNLNVLTELELNMIVEFARRKQVLGIMMSQPCPAPASEDSARTPRSVSRSRRDTNPVGPCPAVDQHLHAGGGPIQVAAICGGLFARICVSSVSNLLPPPPPSTLRAP